MHHGAAGIVEHAPVAEEAAAPNPMGDRRVDHDGPQAHEPHHRRELHAFGEGAGDQRRGDDGEGHLKAHEDRFGNRLGEIVHRVERQTAQEDAAHAAHHRAAGGEGEAVGDHHPQHGHQTRDGEALRMHRGEHVLLAHHAAVEQCETRNGHHQDESRRCEHPRGVTGVELGLLIGRPGGHRQEDGASRPKAGRHITELAESFSYLGIS